MKYFSMFSGIGGFELGMPEDWECVGFSEINKYAIQIYLKHFPKHKNYGSATTIITKQLPDFDLLVGGFPCQAFSIAGKRKGFDDTRGTLFFEIARILADKRPRYFLLENVKGLLSHDNGKTFQTILKVLTDLGYLVEWQVLNSKNHGVPQNRERVFFIGHLGGESRPKVFPIGENSQSDIVLPTLTARYWGGQANGGYIGEKSQEIKQLNNPTHSNNRVYGEEGISPALNTMQGGNRQPKIAIPVLTPDRPIKRQNGRRMKEDGEPSFTLTGQDKHGVMISPTIRAEHHNTADVHFIPQGTKIRRLTPVECARLQGFPDNWHEGVSDSQAYKCYGNAVTVNVVKAIMEKL